MNRDDFPALFRAADTLSNGSQRAFFLALRVHLGALLLAAIMSVLNCPTWWAAAIQTVALLVALSCSVYLAAVRPERLWYSARALAESIKTVSWRYASRAEPFDTDDSTAKTQFVARLKEILGVNKQVAEKLTFELNKAQVTPAMLALRVKPLADRLAHYVTHRIEDQQNWYAAKSTHNATVARRFFGSLIAVNSIAVVLAIIRVRFPDAGYWPTDIFVTLAASLLTWMQARRYSELSSSYALAAQEIGFIHAQAEQSAGDDRKFSVFVGDAENAFSREHTQWTARKDV